MAAWTSRSSRLSTSSSANCARSWRRRRAGATISRRCGAVAMCCGSRRRATTASRPDGKLRTGARWRQLESSRRVDDFLVRHAPALIAHVKGHQPETLGLDLAAAPVGRPWARVAGQLVFAAIEEWGKDQALAVDVGADQQHRSADCIERRQRTLAAQVLKQHAAVVAPAVAVEGWAA